jgi:hypothetical protein
VSYTYIWHPLTDQHYQVVKTNALYWEGYAAIQKVGFRWDGLPYTVYVRKTITRDKLKTGEGNKTIYMTGCRRF